MMLRIIVSIYFIIFPTSIFSKEIPLIVISAGKTVQSYDTVGSTVTVIDSETIKNSSETFLTDLIDSEIGGLNMFQMGGVGTNTGIQIRGLPKRYTTIYIDGVKMNDPSTPDNSFYSQGIFKDNIEKIEILRGSQSSLYGSNAVGGTINIFTKKGKSGKNNHVTFNSDENDTQEFFYSIGGDNGVSNYFLSFGKYLSDGISARIDDDERDAYENETLNLSYEYKFSDRFSIQNTFYYRDTFLEYDEVTLGRTDTINRTDDSQGHYSLKIINDEKKLKNSLIYSKSIMDSNPVTYDEIETNYVGYRDTLNYVGEYNFDLDKKLIFGLDNEFSAANMPSDQCKSKSSGCTRFESDESVFSQYVNYQFRPYERLYTSIGTRFDKHTTAGDEQTYRGTLAYNLGNNSKIRTSYGTGITFPALYDGHNYGWSNHFPKESIVAEKSKSFDIGYETFFQSPNVSLVISYFDIEIEDPLAGWNSKQENSGGKNKSKGMEFSTNWKVKENLEILFNYTYTHSYSGMDCDKPNKDTFGYNTCLDSNNGMLDEAMVRVPAQNINSLLIYNFDKNLNASLKFKYNGEYRDYGNANNGFRDVIVDDYFNVDLSSSYNISEFYNLNLKLKNLFDEKYEQAYGYQGTPRTLSLGLKKSF